MTTLSETELRLCRVLSRRKHNLDLLAVIAATPLAVIVGEGPISNTRSDCPLYPFPKGCVGWRLWKMSGLELTPYLSLFRRVNLTSTPTWDREEAAANARRIRAEAEEAGTPLILLGSRVSSAFRHEPDPFTWLTQTVRLGGAWPDMVRVPHPGGRSTVYNNKEAQAKAGATLREALVRGRHPEFIRMRDEVMPCGQRLSAHPVASLRRMTPLVVTCVGDIVGVGDYQGRQLAMPWGMAS